MANNNNIPHDSISDPSPTDDFFEQILGLSNFSGSSGSGLSGIGGVGPPPMMLQLGSGNEGNHNHMGAIGGGGPVGFHNQMFPLGLSLDQGKGHGFLKPDETGKRFQDDVLDNRCSSMKPVSFSSESSLCLFLLCSRENKVKFKSLGFQNGVVFEKTQLRSKFDSYREFLAQIGEI
jgi:hypothetical protein